MMGAMKIPFEIDPKNPGHRARVDAASRTCRVFPDIASPSICGHAWDPEARRAAYARVAPVWRVRDDGTVPVTYETHADNLWLVQSYHRALWAAVERARDVSKLAHRDQVEALIGAYHLEIWVRTGGARVLTI